jgi:hypothetical protein
MAGAILIIIVLVAVIPVLVIISGGVVAGLIGTALRANGEKTHEGSELIELNN